MYARFEHYVAVCITFRIHNKQRLPFQTHVSNNKPVDTWTVSHSHTLNFQLWLTLAEQHLKVKGVDWTKAEKTCFSEWTNPDDTELGVQIVKVNLHPRHWTLSSKRWKGNSVSADNYAVANPGTKASQAQRFSDVSDSLRLTWIRRRKGSPDRKSRYFENAFLHGFEIESEAKNGIQMDFFYWWEFSVVEPSACAVE